MEALSEDDLEVAGILHTLPELIWRSYHRVGRCPESLRWGAKKKRSAEKQRARSILHSSPETLHPLRPTPPPPPSQRRATGNDAAAAFPSSDVRKPTIKTSMEAEVAERSSPASPLCFYQSGEETDQKPGATVSNLVTVPDKKTMAQKREWIREQTSVFTHLYKANQNLQQERADFATQYLSLYSQNSRLKALKSQRKMEHTSSRIQQENRALPSSAVGPVDPLLAHRERQQSEAFPKVLIDQPLFSADRKMLPEEGAVQCEPGLVSPQFWSLGGAYESGGLGGSGRVSLLPDLNAQLDDASFGSLDQGYSGQEEQLVVVVEQPPRHLHLLQLRPADMKRKETAEARKKRVGINRRKAAATTTTAAALRKGWVDFRISDRSGEC